MKYVKRSLIVFIPLLLCLFLVRAYISTNDFKGRLGSILKASGLNVEFEKVSLRGFNKIHIDNLTVKDQEGNSIIIAEEATARISLLMPTRLSKIDVYKAKVNLERYKDNNFNVFNILKPEDESKAKTYGKASRIGKLYFHDSVLNYTDMSFDKIVKKTLGNVDGYLETARSRGFSLEAQGNAGDERIKVNLKQQVNMEQSLKSLIDASKNNDPEKKSFYLGFEFKDVNITEETGQYVPLEMIRAKRGKLTGNLELSDNNLEKVIKVKGKLNVKDGVLSYEDYEGDIRNADAVIDIQKNNITVDATSTISEGKATFKLDYAIPEQKINIGLTADNVPFSEIARYRIIRESGVKAKGSVTGRLSVEVDQKKKETKMDGSFSSPSIVLGDYRFQNLETRMEISGKQVLTLTDTTFHFDEVIGGFKVKNDVSVPEFIYNIKEKQGSGKYIITNRGSGYSISQVTGTATINSQNMVTGKFASQELDGNYIIDTKGQQMNISAKGKGYIAVSYGGQEYDINPVVDNLVLKFNNKNILQSGNIQAKLKSRKNQYFDLIDADIGIAAGIYNINAVINAKGQNIRAVGRTTSDMYHSYMITGMDNGKIDAARLLRAYGYNLRGLEKASLPMAVTANISGKGNRLSGTYEVYSPYGEYIVEYEQLRAKGKIYDLLGLHLDIDAGMSELWIGYQRFKDVSGNIGIKNNIVSINNVSNEKLHASGTFNLKTGNMKIDSELNTYVVYNTVKPEVNMYIDRATMNVRGPMSNLSGGIVLYPARTTLNSDYIGDTAGIIDIKNSVLDFREFTLRENRLSGSYDLKTGLADMKLSLLEPDIPKLFNIPDLTLGTRSELTLKGDLNKFDLSGSMNLQNISYKGYRLPSIDTDILYSDGNVDKLFKYGTFNIKDFIVRGDNGEELFRTGTSFDFENIDIDYKLENQKFSLDSVKDLKDKGYSGDIDLNFAFRGSPEDFTTALRINSENMTLSGFPVEHLDIDISANNKGVNVGQFFLEYEKNPLLVNGYLNFSPIDYNMSVLIKDFNLEFLGVDKNIKQAGGIADIDIVFSPSHTTGKFLLDNFNYKTADGVTDVDNVNADINIDDRKLNVLRLDGGYNGGTFSVDGNLDVPAIPPDFMRTKRLELGKFELNTTLNSVGIKYGKDIDAVLTGDIIFTENRLFGSITAESGEIRAIPDFASGSKQEEVSSAEQEKRLKEKTIVEGIIEEVIDKILKQYTVDINMHAREAVKLNIPSVSLIRNIKGNISGESRILYENGETGLTGEYIIKRGSFMLNGNRFKIENAEIRFPEQGPGTSLQISPFIVFTASTSVKGERIQVELNGKVDSPDIRFASDSGLSREQIVSLLAFNTSAGSSDSNNGESQDGGVILGSVLNSALNQLIFSPVTGKIGETFGLSNVSITTNFEKSEKTGGYSGSTILYIQDNFYKDKWFWNLQVKFPFQQKRQEGTTSNPIGYNAWINYNVRDGLELKAGGETVSKRDKVTNLKINNKVNYYFGVDFSARADSVSELGKKLFRMKKLDTLTK